MSVPPVLSSRSTPFLCAAVLVALLAPRAAHADALAKNHASTCVPNGQGNASSVTIDPKKNLVTASAATTVLCPITIKTSGPSVTGADGIKSVGVTTTGTVDCTIITRRGPVESATDLNDVGPVFHAKRTSNMAGTLTINTVAGTRPVDYWHAPSYAGYLQPAWTYSYLSCQMSAGATISGDIATTEYGTDVGYSIDPFFTCAFSSDMPWAFDEVFRALPGSGQQSMPGGWIRSQAGVGHQVSFTCPVPANSSIEFMTSSPTVNPGGCNLNNSDLSSVTWKLGDTGGQWPVETVPEPWNPVIEVQAQGTNTLYCGGTNPTGGTLLGDVKWASFRVLPNLSRKKIWKGSASVNNTTDVDYAYDNDGNTRWTSNGPGKANMWFDIDLGANWANIEFNEITFDSGTSSKDDYPRAFTVLLGTDDNPNNLVPLISGTANGHQASINFSEHTAKHVRIRIDKDIVDANKATKYWSIRELNLYFNDGSN